MTMKPLIKKDTNKEYHDNTEFIGSSMLKKYKRSPLHFKEEPDEETPAMFIGSAYHMYILEPDLFSKTYYIFDEMKRPEKDKKWASTKNRNWKAQIYDKYGGFILNKETFGQFKAMKKRLFSHRYAKYLLTTGESELSHYLEFNGIKCKIRPDKINTKKRTIVDLKTTRDAGKDKFFRSAAELGYHISGAFYCDIAEYIYSPGFKWNYILIVQETAEPFAFAIYLASEQFLGVGRYEYELCLEQHKYCKETGKFRGYEVFADNKFGIQEIKVPSYQIKEIKFYNEY